MYSFHNFFLLYILTTDSIQLEDTSYKQRNTHKVCDHELVRLFTDSSNQTTCK